ncbi:tRNA (N6-threonylcarbamoyladenosine(37)-N6)-methyltransferase TrmO [Aquamicrobium segne]|uniref:tRNA (N6-threonylcarbamoyladenosine(37)-N6)-methyltransferase TrmO n=1 Tax=Aquamicrobium segne TaxID=469547 RepID=A0ABW0H0N0_9HYPH
MLETREGEKTLDNDPASLPPDGHVIFIGHIVSPWKQRQQCPKNMKQARERKAAATLVLAPLYREGLSGLEGFTHLHILTWLHHAPRNLIVQKPRHALEAKGVFALRSPARLNPIGLHTARILSMDQCTGTIEIDAIDVLDGTPVLDIKPYFASTDSILDMALEGTHK